MSETARPDRLNISVRLNRKMVGILERLHAATGINSKSEVLRLGLMTLAEEWGISKKKETG